MSRKPKRQARNAQQSANPGINLTTMARSELHESSLELLPFFETMMNPEDHPPLRVPDSHAAMSATFKTPLVVDLPYSGVWNPETQETNPTDELGLGTPVNGYSEVILIPGSTNCYFTTLGDEANLWPLPGGQNDILVPVLATHPVATDLTNTGVQLCQGLRATSILIPENSTAILPKLNSVGNFINEVYMESEAKAAGDQVSLQLSGVNKGMVAQNSTEFRLHVTFEGGSAQFDAHEIISGSGFHTFNFVSPGAGTPIIRFWVEVHDQDQASHWVYSLRSGQTAGEGFSLLLPSRSATAFLVVDAPELNALSETLSERTTALTGLLTYMGSTLQDGGQISAARLGMGLSPLRSPQGDVYKYLASLPFYNDDFPLRNGIYSWWLPDSIQEHFYVPYRAPRSDDLEVNSAMQYALLRDNPNQAVRLKVVQNLEVITRSRLYTSETGPNHPSYSTMVGAMKVIPAVTLNKLHLEFLSRAFGGVKKWLAKPKNWLQLLKFGSKAISTLAPGSKPALIAQGADQMADNIFG